MKYAYVKLLKKKKWVDLSTLEACTKSVRAERGCFSLFSPPPRTIKTSSISTLNYRIYRTRGKNSSYLVKFFNTNKRVVIERQKYERD